MDRARSSHIAHRGLRLCNPAGSARVDRAIDMMSLRPGARVLDIGAGKCEWLARIARRYGVRCVGVEPAPLFAQEASELHADLVAAGALSVVESDAAPYLEAHAGERFDAALCIGASHAIGSYARTLDALVTHTAPGGVIVAGEGYWKKQPDPAYLHALGGDESQLGTHADNIRAATVRACTPLWCTTVTDDEWDEYEWAYARNVETYVREHPSDPDAGEMLERCRAWRDTVLRWGRETLGFGVYVFRAPG